jgi:hypothetical protein
LSLVPSSELSATVKACWSLAAPVEPTCNVVPARISVRFAAGAPWRMKKPDTSLFMLPSQTNLRASNLPCDALAPMSGSIATPRPTMAISLPSFGAAL